MAEEPEQTVRLLDKSRPACIAGIGSRQFYGQDGKHFDMSTLEEVDISTLQPDKPKTPPVLTCKFCGAKRETPELMREHLLALHKADMEKAKIDTGKQCPRCGASKRIGARKGEWQFKCDCYKFEVVAVPEKPKDDEITTAADVLHNKEMEVKSVRKRGGPKKKK